MAYLNGKKIALNPKFLGISDLTQLYKYLGDKVEKEDGTPANIEDVISLIEEINNVGIENLKNKKIVLIPGSSETEGILPVTTLRIMQTIDMIKPQIELDHTVKFMVDGEVYEVVSVKDGNSVNAPTKPKIDGYKFVNWSDESGNPLTLPFTPSTDTNVFADIVEGEDYTDLINGIYEKCGVAKAEYPYITVTYNETNSTANVFVSKFVDLFISSFSHDNSVFRVQNMNYQLMNISVSQNNLKHILETALLKDKTDVYLQHSYQTTFEQPKTVYYNYDLSLLWYADTKPATTSIVYFE